MHELTIHVTVQITAEPDLKCKKNDIHLNNNSQISLNNNNTLKNNNYKIIKEGNNEEGKNIHEKLKQLQIKLHKKKIYLQQY